MEYANPVRRVAAVHDLSGFGRCALTVVIPVLSAMGIQVCPAPTALLSTHTGGFTGHTFLDLTDELAGFFRHWQSLGIEFDCVFSGFLGSFRQIGLVRDFCGTLPAGALRVVDPVLGDDGALYRTITGELCDGMRELVAVADVITPNVTEAAVLLREPVLQGAAGPALVERWLRGLAALGPKKVVLTGVPLGGGCCANGVFDSADGVCELYPYHSVPASFPGTGDTFASVLTGALLRGAALPEAVRRAADFTAEAIRLTHEAGTPQREGVLLERVLPMLWAPERTGG